MANLIDYHIPEAIQIRVTKSSIPLPPIKSIIEQQLIEFGETSTKIDNANENICTFCIDPQLTSLSILQTLIVRGFNLQCDFSLFYLDRTINKKQLISKESDLHQAFLTSSHPCLEISLNVIDYSNPMTNLANEWQLSKNFNKYRNILSEWDIVTNSDIILAQTINKTNNFIFKQLDRIKSKAITTTNNSWYLAETIYQYIIADDNKREEPIDDVTFRSFQDSEGRIISQRDLRIAVYRRGVEQSLRRVIWKHLLNVYPDNYSGQERINFIKLRCETYRQMRDLWQLNSKFDSEVIQLCNMVRKDAYRTDRQHPFYANRKTEEIDEDDNPNVTALFNILITYALNHKNQYCQGMSDLASPLLYVMKDEAHAYITFCALMNRLGENFSIDGLAISRKFTHLSQLLKHYDSDLFRHLNETGAHELLFCYRWLLLDLKREFPFEDSLEMLEVLWASIPPTNSAYMNLFDDGYLYTPSRNKKFVDDTKCQSSLNNNVVTSPKLETKISIKTTSSTSTQSNKPSNKQLRSIKFLPNVLSSDSQILDSPTTSDSDECEFAENLNNYKISNCGGIIGPVVCYSPELSIQRKKYQLEQTSINSILNDCYEATILNESHHFENNDGDYGSTFIEFSKNNNLPTDDNSSCSTFDSGIQRSNTLSSMVQGSDESAHSVNISLNESIEKGSKSNGEASKRRQRFHCLNGLRNAHCNGDDFSEDEGVSGYTENSIDHQKISPFQQENNTCSDVITNHFKNTKPKMKQLIMATTLLSVGKSVSIDSLNNGETIGFEGTKPDRFEIESETNEKSSISVKVDSISDEFNANFEQSAFPKLMTKSVSEEILNNLDNMQTLSVNNNNAHDDASLDNISSSSTSSIVILSKSKRIEGESNQSQTSQPLLSPEELGPNDAFMLFLCLTIMLQNRDRIIESKMDRNDIQMYFDAMIRKHNVRTVLNDARHLFHAYLSQWHKECLHR